MDEEQYPEEFHHHDDDDVIPSEEEEEEYEDDSDEYEAQFDDEDLSTVILNEIKNGTYTCLVCTEEIDDASEIWSCKSCYRAYDLDCIRDWAIKDSKSNLNSDMWRCPSCKTSIQEIPSTYTCWCGKVIGPPSNIFAPHSCGQTCSESLTTCPHACSLPCHPGPHSEICQAQPRLRCDCGAETKQFACIIAPYDAGWKCGKPCDELMPCGIHKHKEICHGGLCGPCEEVTVVKCYCGKHETEIPCYQKVDVNCSSNDNQWIGSYQCQVGEPCAEVLDCNNPNHTCDIQYCHPHDPTDRRFQHKCLLNPKILTKCPCGKCKISVLLGGKSRESCADPVPLCDNVCDKSLKCGHKCYWKCHTGAEHAKCYQPVEVHCNCGFNKFTVPCAFNQAGLKPKCTRKCQTLKNCRRHRCGNICCPYEKIAIKRDQDRKKNNFRSVSDLIDGQHHPEPHNPDDDNMSLEAVHICLEPCHKLLSCKQHRCKWQDHAGKCPPCLESSSDDLMCACERTVLIEAPVRCGAVIKKKCTFQCNRSTSCGHKMPHTCHGDSVACPKCTELVTKKCACGNREIKGVYCFQTRVSCGAKCGKKLSCGLHECTKICCSTNEDHSKMKCTQPCGKTKSKCGHPDLAKCHWPRGDCNENIPCKSKVRLNCQCKRLTKVVECAATNDRTSRSGEVVECDNECLRIKRNQQLMAAFSMDTSSTGVNSADVLVNPYSEYILGVYSKQKKWCEQVENVFRDFVSKWLDDPTTAKKTFHFPAMRKPQRTLIHHLSDVYELYSQSQDSEPRRSVYVAITAKSRLPSLSLFEASISSEATTEALREKRAYEHELTNSMGVAEFNALILEGCKFGATVNELEESLLSIINDAAEEPLNPHFQWVEDGKFLVLPEAHQTFTRKQEFDLENVRDKINFKLDQWTKEGRERIVQLARLCSVDFDGATILKFGAELKTDKPDGLVDDVNKVVEKLQDLNVENKVNYDDKNITDWF
ncbi:Fap1 protein [Saccharomycopsis crataegensis]|uniref:Fap1 protein n=1 Tax=Saccharomycopsis crataegensis TaxID=43959 RepID=A0AAV5QLA5_9ASCO|nr:Fap1 protein [Saccharomycopsis crataegensis]